MSVPRVPGVPPTLDGFTDPPPLGGDTLPPNGSDGSGDSQWGIYKDGSLVVTPDNIVSFAFKQEFTIADFPQEQGAFQSYDKVQTPFDIRIQASKGGSVDDRTAFLASIDAIMPTTDVYDVYTAEKVYSNVNWSHRDFKRQGDANAGLIVVDLWGVEIRDTANTGFGDTGDGGGTGNSQGPGGAGQQNNGITQTEDVRVTGEPLAH